MTAPPPKVRKATYVRDSYMCAECGTTTNLSWQHRESSGHGGRGKKAPPLTPADGLTLCLPHNVACEAEGQAVALAMGWKLRRNRQMPASAIPVYIAWAREWWLLDEDGGHELCNPNLAQELLAGAGNISPDGVVF
jgi:hypothetical protein